VTQFDFIVLGLLLISAAVGFARGAVREVVKPGWLGTIASLVVVFLVAFIALRLIGAVIARQVQNTQMLGFLDRSLGLLIGLGRGLIVLGALFLMFNAATPDDLRPRWITGAKTWPLAAGMGGIIEGLVPQGLDLADRMKPAFDRAVGEGSRDRTATDGYEAREPTSTDRQERSR
jgi:membrane protein required for colicin V production